jgi:hypothetical protein
VSELGGYIAIIESVLAPFAIFGVIGFIKTLGTIIRIQYKQRFYEAIKEESG